MRAWMLLLAVAPSLLGFADPAPPVAAPPPAAPLDAARAAALFGARESIHDISLSPDGRTVAYVRPAAGRTLILSVIAVEGTSAPVDVTYSNGDAGNLEHCDWVSDDRIVCRIYGITSIPELVPMIRLMSVDTNGSNVRSLVQGSSTDLYLRQFDGDIIGWPADRPGSVLMTRVYVPQSTIGTRLASSKEGLGVDLVDTRNLRIQRVEQPSDRATNYIADASGTVRIMETADVDNVGMLTGTERYSYRRKDSRDWEVFSVSTHDSNAMIPIAIDGEHDAAWAYARKDGRMALYRVSLKGDLAAELVYAHPQVDVANVISFGRSGKVIGAEVVTDRRQAIYFDPAYQRIANSLARALPGLPLIRFISASADESKVIVFAGSDVDPGRYYFLDWATRRMTELSPARSGLVDVALSPVRAVSFRAADGTAIPAYLTLPRGGAQRGLPAIVMPHGGPAARDEWGFDWLAQYFAQRGYAVLQPNFRGSAGYGDDWYLDNGFRSWRTAVGDVTDGGRWLISEGIADPAKLAVVGWSYGGYAALQANVLDADLFKAVIAIAPVTDLATLKTRARRFTTGRVVGDYIGAGPHIAEGSPTRNVARFKAPVLMFSGDRDLNVDISQARAMDRALRGAGKRSELIVYPMLDHQIDDSAARTDLLSRSDAFLRAAMGM